MILPALLVFETWLVFALSERQEVLRLRAALHHEGQRALAYHDPLAFQNYGLMLLKEEGQAEAEAQEAGQKVRSSTISWAGTWLQHESWRHWQDLTWQRELSGAFQQTEMTRQAILAYAQPLALPNLVEHLLQRFHLVQKLWQEKGQGVQQVLTGIFSPEKRGDIAKAWQILNFWKKQRKEKEEVEDHKGGVQEDSAEAEVENFMNDLDKIKQVPESPGHDEFASFAKLDQDFVLNGLRYLEQGVDLLNQAGSFLGESLPLRLYAMSFFPAYVHRQGTDLSAYPLRQSWRQKELRAGNGEQAYQLEYLLIGQEKDTLNLLGAWGIIFAQRLLWRLLSAQLDSAHMSRLLQLGRGASVAVTFVTGGSLELPPEVYQRLFWLWEAAARGLWDTYRLMQGKSCRLLPSVKKSPETFYHDYLLPMVLLTPENKLLERMSNIIEATCGGSLYTGVTLSVQARNKRGRLLYLKEVIQMEELGHAKTRAAQD